MAWNFRFSYLNTLWGCSQKRLHPRQSLIDELVELRVHAIQESTARGLPMDQCNRSGTGRRISRQAAMDAKKNPKVAIKSSHGGARSSSGDAIGAYPVLAGYAGWITLPMAAITRSNSPSSAVNCFLPVAVRR
jgi:hypothetical protein